MFSGTVRARDRLDFGGCEDGKAEAAENECTADEPAHRRVGALAKATRDLHADERKRRGAEQHPEGEARMHGPEHPVSHGPERLEDRAVQDVSADGDLRVEPEEEDEDRRHQGATAHPGHADQDPDEQAGKRKLPGQRDPGIGQETKGRPVRRHASLYASQPVQKPVVAASSASTAAIATMIAAVLL